jgi:peptidyl-prolyl cis-trans isomerase D
VGPVRTPFGFHLIEVVDRRPAGTRSFDAVRGQIQARLLADRTRTAAESRATELADRLRREKIESTDQLQEIADQTDATRLVTTEPFGSGDIVPDIGAGGEFSDTAFALEVGGISDPIQTARGWVVLRLAAIDEPRLPELDEVADAVREALESERRTGLALARLAEVAAANEGDGRLEAIAAELDLKIQEPAEFGRGGTLGALGVQPQVVDRALALEAGQFSEPIEVPGGVVLFEVVERRKFDPTEFAAQKEQTLEALRNQRLDQLLASLLDARREATEIEYNPQILEALGLQGEALG